MSFCKVCNKAQSLSYVLNNKLVCLECDELTFDIEIEDDHGEFEKKAPVPSKERSTAVPQKRTKATSKS